MPEEPLILPEQTITTEETEFEHFDENNTASFLSFSEPVYEDDTNTTVRANGKDVDLSVGDTLYVRVQSEVNNFMSIDVSIDNSSIMTYEVVRQDYSGLMIIRVTALNVGIATVTATVTYGITSSVMETETATLELYVTMDNGIYAIRSCATHLPTSMGDYYLRAENLNADIPNVYASTNKYGDIKNNIYRYWKVEYAGNGEYVINALVDDTMALGALGTQVTVMNDSSSFSRWIIRYRVGGYEIVTASSAQDGEGMVLSTSSVQTGQYSSIEYYYYAEPTLFEVQNMAFERWNFESVNVSGVYFRNIQTVRISESLGLTRIFSDDTLDLNDLGYKLVAFGYDETSGYPVWTTSSSTVATVDASSGTINPQKCGTVTFTVTIHGTQLSANITVKFIMIEDGTYYLRNLQNNLYADVYNGTMANNNIVEQQTFDGANTQKWVFTCVSENIYTICSAQNTNYYLGVAGNSTTNGANVVLRTGTVTNGMKWRIVAGEEGYKIVSYLSSVRVLKAADSTVSSDLVSGAYTADSNYLDEWYIVLKSDAIQLEAQEETSWCWAACARMASTKYMYSPISQASAAVYIKSGIKTNNPTDAQINTANEGAEVDDTARALEYILGSSGNTYYSSSIYTKSELCNLLDAGNVVIVLRGWYTNGKRNSGHYTLIHDYYMIGNTTVFCIYDPLDVRKGSSYVRSYDWICDGRNNTEALENEDEGRWDGTVTFKIGDYLLDD